MEIIIIACLGKMERKYIRLCGYSKDTNLKRKTKTFSKRILNFILKIEIEKQNTWNHKVTVLVDKVLLYTLYQFPIVRIFR